jgi:hypothetical protein
VNASGQRVDGSLWSIALLFGAMTHIPYLCMPELLRYSLAFTRFPFHLQLPPQTP